MREGMSSSAVTSCKYRMTGVRVFENIQMVMVVGPISVDAVAVAEKLHLQWP